ncbi:MAG: hypothetical protein CFE24_06905 [Flavobacterium sp. BFFFF2]|nr:MAG: hypothetical protein CFE24_06905 [Flavobacterium sp. BFFFF2]
MKKILILVSTAIAFAMLFVYLCTPVSKNFAIDASNPKRIYFDTVYPNHGTPFANYHGIRIKGYVNDTIWYKIKDYYPNNYLIHDVNISIGEHEFYDRTKGTLIINMYKATKGHLTVEHRLSTF